MLPSPQSADFCTHKWTVNWWDLYNCGEIAGHFECAPFVEDPPVNTYLGRLTKGLSKTAEIKKACEAVERRFNDECEIRRPAWKLRRIIKLQERCEEWRRAAGLKVKEMAWADVARAVRAPK
eukprot:1191792-Prorocentrum_minimum.AAC.3